MLRAYSADWSGQDKDEIHLSREEQHHLAGVRRVRAGERIEVLNGRGAVAQCTVQSVNGRQPQLEVLSVARIPFQGPQIHLKCALCKGKGFAAVLQKAVELGVHSVTPLNTAHVEAKPDTASKKGDRWDAILIEALKQSGNPWLPRLGSLSSLPDELAQPIEGVRICAALQDDALPLKDWIQQELDTSSMVHLYVGPEGDFSAVEYAALRDAGAYFATLGPLVMRVETAASLAIGALRLMAGPPKGQ